MLGSSQKVIEDIGSEEMRLVRLEMNKILDAVDVLVAASQEADFATFKASAAAVDTSTLRKVLATRERPAAPAFPTP